MERVVYYNGEFVPEKDAVVHIYDQSFQFGSTVFETIRSFNKNLFKLDEHLNRLRVSVKYLGIGNNEWLEDAIYSTARENEPLLGQNNEHRIVINITEGMPDIYKECKKGISKNINVIISDCPLSWTISGMGKLYDCGINAIIPSQRQIPAHLLEPKVKNRSRLHYLMAQKEIENYKGDNNWALLLDTDGFIAEGIGSNFFIVKDKVVITPEGRNILRGISRAYIFELCEQLNLRCVERNIELYDVLYANEAFMTATPFCILPVTSLNNKTISEKMGDITKLLLDTWSKNVGVDIIKQTKSYG